MVHLSFALLAEGSAQKSTWRPDEDETQWWSRRDALVRCTALALWSFQEVTPTGNISTVDEVSLIYPDDELTVMRVDSNLTSEIKVPCERALIRCFKNAAGVQEKGARRMAGFAVDWKGVQCTRQAWRASQLERGTTSAGAEAVFESFSKREALRAIILHNIS